MEPSIQTSFIPKQPLRQAPIQAPERFGFLSSLAVIILIIVALFTAILYAYHWYLDGQINRACQVTAEGVPVGCGLKATLDRKEEELNKSTLQEYQRLDVKFKTARTLVDNHITMLPLLDFFNQSTLSTIRYKKLTQTDEGLALEGVAARYEDIAIQAANFRTDKRVRSFTFSDFVLDNQNNVNFKLALSLDPRLLSYRAFLTNHAVTIPAIIASSTASSTISI
ncbi:MAG: hypothetical protein HYV76_00645 [Candidatus Vogelbacteria bacterium]|nr:hypothetical protein [Candidatus Vogelbacteria bacterium]